MERIKVSSLMSVEIHSVSSDDEVLQLGALTMFSFVTYVLMFLGFRNNV